MTKTFLQAEWRKLLMINYSIDRKILDSYLPKGTEIDLWNNTCYVSLVGFMFMHTRVKGLKIPFHVNFEEVNLRFYVKYNDKKENKRGVVFIKEIVPRPLLSVVANFVYKEQYQTLPMRHSWDKSENMLTVAYRWKKKRWNEIKVIAENTPTEIVSGSEEEFITEHYWGYTKINDQKTAEYEVVHPKWKVYPINEFSIDVDFRNTYGENFEFLTSQKPVSIFLAEGSEIEVKTGRRL